MGANVIRDIFATVTDIIGGRSGAYEEKLHQAREIALAEMAEKAQRLGANAVVGVDIDYEVVREGMLAELRRMKRPNRTPSRSGSSSLSVSCR